MLRGHKGYLGKGGRVGRRQGREQSNIQEELFVYWLMLKR